MLEMSKEALVENWSLLEDGLSKMTISCQMKVFIIDKYYPLTQF